MEELKDKSQLYHGVEMLLRQPEDINLEALHYRGKMRLLHQSKKNDAEIILLAAQAVVDDYSKKSAISGGATALTGIVPGIGTVVAALGGTIADAALTMKFEVEMVMNLAVLYGYDLQLESTRDLAFTLAGLGVIVSTEKQGLDRYIEMVKQTIAKGRSTIAGQLFNKVATALAKKAVGKVIPMGIGVMISASANKKLTSDLGNHAIGYFSHALTEGKSPNNQ